MTPPATVVHAARQRSLLSPDCVQDSVSLPLVPRGNAHVVYPAEAPSPPQPQGAAADSDPFLDEDSNSGFTQYTTSSSQLPAYGYGQVWDSHTPGVHAGDALCAGQDGQGAFRGYGGTPPTHQTNPPTRLPWADELSTYSPTCRGVGPNSHGQCGQCGGQTHACTCCRLQAAEGRDMHPAFACASVRTSRSISSSPTRPHKAFLGGCEIRGTLSRALAEIGGQSSGSLALDNGSGNGSNGLACVAGGAGVIGTSFLGYPFDTWRSTDLEGASEHEQLQHAARPQHAGVPGNPALAALLRRRSAGSSGVHEALAERVSREPYLGPFRLPAAEGPATPPPTRRECVQT